MILLNLIMLFGVICVKGISQNRQACVPASEIKLDERVLAEREAGAMGIAEIAVSGQRVVDVRFLEREGGFSLEEEELEILMRIVEAEAGNQDVEGRLLVANVVLNRVESEKFPNSVKDVVFQAENGVNQFSPVSNGSIWTVKVSEDTGEAVERALRGEDLSDGALYFVARRYADGEKVKWFDTHLTYLFEHGGHEFYR